eukprot:TRINITY_DN2389_c0_g2_i2.p1 TRINITY_DN2389_c0_g2~~TRINITY_DN2389_c0_g2_i2.p1  ORF type:complete len:690 (-),score=37.82 TRINITY_DN2389_c0_g2_i2:1614-3506(-)
MRVFGDCWGYVTGFVDSLLVFQTQKAVNIMDRRLGLLLRLIQLGVLGYVAWDIINQEGYLVTQIPQGSISVYAEGGKQYTLANMYKAMTTAQHCTQPDLYNFYYNKRFVYKDFECIVTDPFGSSDKLDSSIFIDTYMTESRYVTVKSYNESGCWDVLRQQEEREGTKLQNATFDAFAEGLCVFQDQEHIFPSIPETVYVSFTHQFSTTTSFDMSATQPVSYLRNRNREDILKVFQKGEDIGGVLSQWLEWAELDLDLPHDKQPAVLKGYDNVVPSLARTWEYVENGTGQSFSTEDGDRSDEIYPRLRVSGVTLLIKLRYYNYRLSPIAKELHQLHGSHDFHCVIDIDPVIVWTSRGSNLQYSVRDFKDPRYPTLKSARDNDTRGFLAVDMYSYGVKFAFQTEGVIGKFSIGELIQSITNGLVLLATASTIVTMVALYAMGQRSELYAEFIREKVDWRLEYAKFAAQAVVAAYVFQLMDTNSDNQLDASELYAVLSTLFGHKMTAGQLASLTDFVLRNYDKDHTRQERWERQGSLIGGRSGRAYVCENPIDMDGWIHIFCSGKASIDKMIRTIDFEYKDQKPRVSDDMRNAVSPLFLGVHKQMKGDSLHPSRSDPLFVEIDMMTKSSSRRS